MTKTLDHADHESGDTLGILAAAGGAEAMSRWLDARAQAEGTGISADLSEEINLLGEMLGAAVREEGGDRIFDLVETLRTLCKRAATEGRDDLLDEAGSMLRDLTLEEISWMLRSFTAFFHLANQAEQQEIVRINRQRAGAIGRGGTRPESIDDAIGQLRKQNVPLEQVVTLLGRLEIEPTLTAHPTEARRRSILDKQRRIAAILRGLGGKQTPEEEAISLDDLYAQISLLIATDEVRAERPTVEHEVEQGLYFLQGTIWEALPWIHRDILRAVRRHYGVCIDLRPTVRYRSWIGGDRDGNPNVTAELTRSTLRTHRMVALRKHIEEMRALLVELSISDRHAEVPARLYDSLEQDRAELGPSVTADGQFRSEPYRRKIANMLARLEGRLARDEAGDASTGPGEAAPYGADRYVADLELLDSCLRESGFGGVALNGRLQRTRVLAESFGFRLAALDIRQHSRVHEKALTEILRTAGVVDDYASLAEDAKVRLLADELDNPRPLLHNGTELDPTTAEAMATFELIREALQEDPTSIGSYIVSMTHAVSDLLEPMLLAKEAGLWTRATGAPLDFVPLFETIEDLETSPDRMRALFANPVYNRHLEQRGRFQEIMLGYSDSNKDGGYWMANWALHKAQEGLGRACEGAGVAFRLFHGRGGTVGRGGGRASHAILAMPREARNRRIRITEQGEVISFRYGIEDIAHRHLEQVVHAMIIAQTPDVPRREPGNEELMWAIAKRSMKAYRDLIDANGFWEWYTTITPIEQISLLPIASRPVSRGSGSQVEFEDLRAIPWVFAWTQIRLLVPGWYGAGTALLEAIDEAPDTETLLRELYQDWAFFRAIVDNAERELARARLAAARRYIPLGSHTTSDFYQTIADELERTRSAILRITGRTDILEGTPVIQKSISLRNPYTDALNLLQVELLRRQRESPSDQDREMIGQGLFVSINGVAAAMQSTG